MWRPAGGVSEPCSRIPSSTKGPRTKTKQDQGPKAGEAVRAPALLRHYNSTPQPGLDLVVRNELSWGFGFGSWDQNLVREREFPVQSIETDRQGRHRESNRRQGLSATPFGQTREKKRLRQSQSRQAGRSHVLPGCATDDGLTLHHDGSRGQRCRLIGPPWHPRW